MCCSVSGFGFGSIPPFYVRGTFGASVLALPAAGSVALTDKIVNITAGGVVQTETLTQVFALLDDQPITWTATQAWSAQSNIVGPGTPNGATTKWFEVAGTIGSTSGSRYGFVSTMAAAPGSSSTANIVGVAGFASQSAQNNTGASGLQAFRGGVSYTGSGAVTAASIFVATPAVNSGGGSIATVNGFLCEALAVGTTRWAFNAVSDAANFGGGATFGLRADLKSYTVATLPAAGVGGGCVYVSDAAVAACVAFSNGSNWKRCDNAATTVI